MYIFDVNKTVPVSQAVAIYDLKAVMKLAGYTVKGSGDGNAAFSSTTDIITNSGSGANGINNTDAWFTIRQPTGGSAPYSGTREWTFQRSSSSQSWFCEYSGPDTIFDQSTGSATVRPTGVLAGQVKSFTPSGGASSILPNNTLFTYQIFVGDSTENFNWYLQCYTLGGTTTNGRVMFAPMQSNSITPTEDDPFILCATNSNLTLTTLSVGTSSEFFGWQGKNGIINTWAMIAGWIIANTSTNTGGFPNYMGTNLTNRQDDTVPIVWGRRAGAGQGGLKGITTVMRWPSNLRETGALYDNATKIRYNDVVMVWDGSNPPYI